MSAGQEQILHFLGWDIPLVKIRYITNDGYKSVFEKGSASFRASRKAAYRHSERAARRVEESGFGC